MVFIKGVVVILKLVLPLPPGASVVGPRLEVLPTTLGNRVLIFDIVVPENRPSTLRNRVFRSDGDQPASHRVGGNRKRFKQSMDADDFFLFQAVKIAISIANFT